MIICLTFWALIITALVPEFLTPPTAPELPIYPGIYESHESQKLKQPSFKPSLSKHFRNGIKFFRQKKYKKAIEEFTCEVSNCPANSFAFCYRAMCYDRLEDEERAFADYNRAVTIGPNAWILFKRAEFFYYNLKDYVCALKDLNAAVYFDPGYSDAFALRGWIKFIKNRESVSSIRDLNHAILLDPSNGMAFIDRGTVYFICQAYQFALKDFDRGLALQPNCHYIYRYRGELRADFGDRIGAIEDFSKSISEGKKLNTPEDFLEPSYRYRAYFRLDTGDIGGAIADISKTPSALFFVPFVAVLGPPYNLYYDLKYKYHNFTMPTEGIGLVSSEQISSNKKTPTR